MRPAWATGARPLAALAALCLCAAAWSAPATRDVPQAPPAASRPERAPPVPLLWKVSDADNSVYLLGSFHLLRPDDYPLSAEVDAAFADAESLLFELAPEEMQSPALALQMGQAALRMDGTALDSELPPATAHRLKAWLDANAEAVQRSGMSPQTLQMFEPWFVALTLSITEMTREGLDPELGLDRYFAAAAEAAGKPTAGFETGAQQIAFLDGMGRREQVQFLDETLQEAEQGGGQVEALHAAWRRGDADGLWSGMAADMRRDYPQLYRHVNVERNDAWLPVIERRLAAAGTDDTLVVVGSLHLLGSDGLVDKLRARGYRVERICAACRGGGD